MLSLSLVVSKRSCPRPSSRSRYVQLCRDAGLGKTEMALQAGDRVVVIGVDDQPFEKGVATKDLTATFQKILLVPAPDYGTRLVGAVLGTMVDGDGTDGALRRFGKPSFRSLAWQGTATWT